MVTKHLLECSSSIRNIVLQHCDNERSTNVTFGAFQSVVGTFPVSPSGLAGARGGDSAVVSLPPNPGGILLTLFLKVAS